MPLPPALAARLAKRGLLKANGPQDKSSDSTKRGSEEEVFAESYDDQEENLRKQTANLNQEADKSRLMGFPGCPNKWNPYHECQPFCLEHWSSGHQEPQTEYLQVFQKMMKDYEPLPDEWEEKYDPGAGRHYFWNRRSDRVSWFPPGHPKARITEAASHVREILQSQLSNINDDEDDDEEEEGQAMELDSDMSDGEEDEEDRELDEKRRREKERRKEQEEHYKRKDSGRKRRSAPGKDPMDPSSYSDAPPGTWSSGLVEKDE